jgi:hypothetical protein
MLKARDRRIAGVTKVRRAQHRAPVEIDALRQVVAQSCGGNGCGLQQGRRHRDAIVDAAARDRDDQGDDK